MHEQELCYTEYQHLDLRSESWPYSMHVPYCFYTTVCQTRTGKNRIRTDYAAYFFCSMNRERSRETPSGRLASSPVHFLFMPLYWNQPQFTQRALASRSSQWKEDKIIIYTCFQITYIRIRWYVGMMEQSSSSHKSYNYSTCAEISRIRQPRYFLLHEQVCSVYFDRYKTRVYTWT